MHRVPLSLDRNGSLVRPHFALLARSRSAARCRLPLLCTRLCSSLQGDSGHILRRAHYLPSVSSAIGREVPPPYGRCFYIGLHSAPHFLVAFACWSHYFSYASRVHTSARFPTSAPASASWRASRCQCSPTSPLPRTSACPRTLSCVHGLLPVTGSSPAL